MGVTKTDYYSTDQNELAIIAKALGHPARIAIIEHLLTVNSCFCSDVVNELSLAQPTISQHLQILKNAKLIKGTINGASLCYCLDKIGIDIIIGFLNKIKLQLHIQRQDCY
ncbi:MAG: hypothetical protein RLZZ312_188 [Bacteroidota bacterium]|jgi:predicted transcriptional regulator